MFMIYDEHSIRSNLSLFSQQISQQMLFYICLHFLENPVCMVKFDLCTSELFEILISVYSFEHSFIQQKYFLQYYKKCMDDIRLLLHTLPASRAPEFTPFFGGIRVAPLIRFCAVLLQKCMCEAGRVCNSNRISSMHFL
jgi:hypothetical protein